MNTEKHNNYDENKDKHINAPDSLKQSKDHKDPDGLLPEDDPQLINPDELATFPKEVEDSEDVDIDAERGNPSINRKTSPARDGSNITRTDNSTENDRGFL